MLVVIDANELFSLLIRGSTKSETIFFSDNIELIAPEFLLIEFAGNRDDVLSKTHRSKSDFSGLFSLFERRIRFIPKEDFREFIPGALSLLSKHPKDVPYFALCLKFNCPLWSEEKLLKKQSSVKVFNTNELFSLLTNKP